MQVTVTMKRKPLIQFLVLMEQSEARFAIKQKYKLSTTKVIVSKHLEATLCFLVP